MTPRILTPTFRPAGPGAPTRAEAAAAEPPKPGIMGLIREILGQYRENLLANFLFIGGLVIGFLHGWLKLKYRYTLVTFAYDIPMALGLALVILKIPRGKALFPTCAVSSALKFLLGVAIAYTLFPSDLPWVVRISSFRGWCFAPLMMLLGYHLVRSVRQMETFVWAVILLGAGTAYYGIFHQTEADVRALIASDPELEFKLRGNFYATSAGLAEFRRFSTFVSSAVFGATMSISTLFAVSRLGMAGIGWFQRLVLFTCAGLCAYAVVLTGSRTSLILVGLGLIITAAFTKGALRLFIAPLILLGAVYLGIKGTSGAAAERFGSILESNAVIGRVMIVINPMLDALWTYPIGGGIGRAGHGVPFVFYQALFESNAVIRSIDGDLGRLVVDMGFIGLVIYIVLLYSGLSDCIKWMLRLRESNLAAIAIPAGGLFMLGLVQVPTGSPYIGIPAGMLLWILFGGLRRMVDEYDRLKQVEGDAVEDLPQFVTFVQSRKMRSLFTPGTKTSPVARAEAGRIPDARHRQPGTTPSGRQVKRRIPFHFGRKPGGPS